jgi:hypothetical protein
MARNLSAATTVFHWFSSTFLQLSVPNVAFRCKCSEKSLCFFRTKILFAHMKTQDLIDSDPTSGEYRGRWESLVPNITIGGSR